MQFFEHMFSYGLLQVGNLFSVVKIPPVTITIFFRYVHYEVDNPLTSDGCKADNSRNNRCVALPKHKTIDPAAKLDPPQWIQCDLRFLDMTVLGKFAVIMADPPWDIHMELPYGMPMFYQMQTKSCIMISSELRYNVR